VIIAVMVVLSLALNLFQTYRSQRAERALQKHFASTVTVRRDGGWREIPRSELVVGDLFRIEAGEVVPADGLLVRSEELHVQEAALTGESLPVEKSSGAGDSGGDRQRVFLGTSAVSGSGIARTTATGPRTQYGAIAARLAARPPETEFERGTRQFGMLILKTVIVLVLFVLCVNILVHRNPLESLLFAIALAVGLTPEFLPMITSVTLAGGAIRMARKKVIVRRLEAIQNLGSIDVLCSDKTGTLTTGELTVAGSWDASGGESPRPLALARENSALQSGVHNPLDEVLARSPGERELRTKLGEIPFDFERKRLTVVVSEGSGARLLTKGAPEAVLPFCDRMDSATGPAPLEPAGIARAEETYRSLCVKGFRVLAVAWRDFGPGASSWTAADETCLVLAGFIAFSDPPLPGAARAIEMLVRDGVQVKLLTGDNELVACETCSAVGLPSGRVVLGEEVARTTPVALGPLAERTSVFARVSPLDKNRILLALKSRGHVVGFLGDGINDAPCLRAADVGVSVSNAVEVAREAASILLTERSLSVLHDGIREGRRAFGNVMKYLLMGTSSNFGNMFSMAVASIFLPFLPMLPTQILLNNFLYDLAQVSIPTDRVDGTYLRKPQRWDVRLLRNFMLFVGPLSSLYDFLTFFVLLRFFHASEAFFHTGWFIESLTTQTLVIFVIRTAGNPLRSRPSVALAATALGVVAIGFVLPQTPLAAVLGFVPMPASFFLFVLGASSSYLVLVEIAKRMLLRHADRTQPASSALLRMESRA